MRHRRRCLRTPCSARTSRYLGLEDGALGFERKVRSKGMGKNMRKVIDSGCILTQQLANLETLGGLFT